LNSEDTLLELLRVVLGMFLPLIKLVLYDLFFFFDIVLEVLEL
jgi:hypothetical protein